GKKFDLSALRCVLSTGSPLSDELFRWTYDNVKPDLQLASISGGTDIISCFMLGNPILPVYAGEIQCRGFGMDVQAWDQAGQPGAGEKGELVCASPFPCQPVKFWNDPDGRKYRAAYFDYFTPENGPQTPPSTLGGSQTPPSVPGPIWRHGDYIEITD